MLVLRNYNVDEIEKIKSFLINEGVEDLSVEGIVYLVVDNNDLVGVGKAIPIDNKYLLEYLIIREDKRNQKLGDALLRAILNKLLNISITMVYGKANDTYLVKKGFTLNSDNQLELNIADFFSKACNGCGGCNEL